MLQDFRLAAHHEDSVVSIFSDEKISRLPYLAAFALPCGQTNASLRFSNPYASQAVGLLPSPNQKAQATAWDFLFGEGGIRTLDTLTGIHDFESCAFDHSATSPWSRRGQKGIMKPKMSKAPPHIYNKTL